MLDYNSIGPADLISQTLYFAHAVKLNEFTAIESISQVTECLYRVAKSGPISVDIGSYQSPKVAQGSLVKVVMNLLLKKLTAFS